MFWIIFGGLIVVFLLFVAIVLFAWHTAAKNDRLD